MVFPSFADKYSGEVGKDNGGVKSKIPRHQFSKKGVRRLSRKRRKARRKRERNIKERKEMTSFDNGPYDFFWGNYFRCVKWVQNHHSSYWKSRAQALEYENKMLRAIVEQSTASLVNFSDTSGHSENCKMNVSNGEKSSKLCTAVGLESETETVQQSDPSFCARPGQKVYTDSSYPSGKKCDSDNEEFEFEVDENMIEFFTQSMKHKLELQRERNESNEKDRKANSVSRRSRRKKSDCVSESATIDDDGDDDESGYYAMMGLKKVLPTQCFEQNEVIEDTDLQDILQRKAQREEKEKQKHNLFGKSASKILGMETAVQLNFRQTCATKRPVVWPIIPLNL